MIFRIFLEFGYVYYRIYSNSFFSKSSLYNIEDISPIALNSPIFLGLNFLLQFLIIIYNLFSIYHYSYIQVVRYDD